MPRVLLVDDHHAVQAGLRELLVSKFPGMQIEFASSEQSLLSALKQGHFDVALLDLNLGGKSRLELIPAVKQMRPKVKILVYTMHPESEFGLRVFRAGADGFVSKDAPIENLFVAVRQLLEGRKYVSADLAERLALAAGGNFDAEPHLKLSPREYEIFRLLAIGLPHGEIAERLQISRKTVSTVQFRILEKLELKSRSDLVLYAHRNGLIER